MNILSSLIKCASAGFVIGFIASNASDFHINLFDLTGAIVIIGVAFVLREITNLERVTGADEGGLEVTTAIG